jgi:hypothetical protein
MLFLLLLVLFCYGPGSDDRSEHFFGCTANRTAPLLGQVPETGSLRNLSPPVSPVRVIKTPAVYGLTLKNFFGFCHGVLLCDRTKRLFTDTIFPAMYKNCAVLPLTKSIIRYYNKNRANPQYTTHIFFYYNFSIL